MTRFLTAILVALAVASLRCEAAESTATTASETSWLPQISLTGDDDCVSATEPAVDTDTVRTSCIDVSRQRPRSDDESCRMYAAKILGVTFVDLKTSAMRPSQSNPAVPPAWNNATSNSGSLFTAALAGGLRVPRHFGDVRVECEGALRDNFAQASNVANQTAISVRANDNWTVLANVWRDVPLSRRLGAYAGGGLGGGGYWLDAASSNGSAASAQSAVFAWQAGAGALWKYNSLIDLDVSYRFLDLGHTDAVLREPGLGSVGTISSKMTAGELFFMLRVYEPFQWRKHLLNPDFYLPE